MDSIARDRKTSIMTDPRSRRLAALGMLRRPHRTRVHRRRSGHSRLRMLTGAARSDHAAPGRVHVAPPDDRGAALDSRPQRGALVLRVDHRSGLPTDAGIYGSSPLARGIECTRPFEAEVSPPHRAVKSRAAGVRFQRPAHDGSSSPSAPEPRKLVPRAPASSTSANAPSPRSGSCRGPE